MPLHCRHTLTALCPPAPPCAALLHPAPGPQAVLCVAGHHGAGDGGAPAGALRRGGWVLHCVHACMHACVHALQPRVHCTCWPAPAPAPAALPQLLAAHAAGAPQSRSASPGGQLRNPPAHHSSAALEAPLGAFPVRASLNIATLQYIILILLPDRRPQDGASCQRSGSQPPRARWVHKKQTSPCEACLGSHHSAHVQRLRAPACPLQHAVGAGRGTNQLPSLAARQQPTSNHLPSSAAAPPSPAPTPRHPRKSR